MTSAEFEHAYNICNEFTIKRAEYSGLSKFYDKLCKKENSITVQCGGDDYHCKRDSDDKVSSDDEWLRNMLIHFITTKMESIKQEMEDIKV